MPKVMVRLPHKVMLEVRRLSKNNGLSVSFWVSELVKQSIENSEWPPAIGRKAAAEGG